MKCQGTCFNNLYKSWSQHRIWILVDSQCIYLFKEKFKESETNHREIVLLRLLEEICSFFGVCTHVLVCTFSMCVCVHMCIWLFLSGSCGGQKVVFHVFLYCFPPWHGVSHVILSTCLQTHQGLGLQTHDTVFSFYMGAWVPNSDLHRYYVST